MIDATVIVAAYRAEKTLCRAVSSALAQRDVRLEVIVVDDASPDGTLELAQGLARADDRVRVLALPRNGGPAAARNAALAEAQGRWTAILDADDAMMPGRLAHMIALGNRTGADLVFDDFQPVDSAGCPVGPSHLSPLDLTAPERWSLTGFLKGCQAESGRPQLGYLKPLFRMEFLRQNALSYDASLRNGEDFHIVAASLAEGGMLWVTQEPGYLYTVAAGSVSSQLDPGHARALIAADQVFLKRYRTVLTAQEAALMRRRMRRFADFGTAEEVLQSLRKGHVLRAAGVLVRRPQATARLLRQVTKALSKRLT